MASVNQNVIWVHAKSIGIIVPRSASEIHLVKPPLHWDMQPVWDPDAEKLHGISLEQLHAQGRPPFEVARRMNEVLAGRELISDGPADDERWLRIVFGEAGLHPAFTIRRTDADVLTSQLAAELGWDSASYEVAKSEAEHISPGTHRAEADARHWISKGTAARRRTD